VTGGRGRRADDPKLAAAFTEQWLLVAAAVDAAADEAFAGPSPLPGWTVGDLVAHCVRSGGALAAAVGAPAGPGAGPVSPGGRRAGDGGAVLDTVSYLGGVGARAEAIADTARTDAGGLAPADLRTRLREAVAASVAALEGELNGVSFGGAVRAVPADTAAVWEQTVPSPGGPVRLGDFVVTRCVEGVVHGLDLGVAPGRDALRIVTRAFVDLLAARAPGRSVELRVPPFAAVQVVEGPQHTRGTPPNVAEADPVAFVAVAAGRLGWDQAVADGRITASGERADLRPYLPLL
jgi:uncharacterized protein (TIGR03083 family)